MVKGMSEEISVGYIPTPGMIYPRFENSGQLEGFEYDLLEFIADKLRIKFKYTPISDLDDLQSRVHSDDPTIDIGCGAIEGSSNIESQLDILFPHLPSESVVVIKKSLWYWIFTSVTQSLRSKVMKGLVLATVVFAYIPALLTTLIERGNPDSSFYESGSILITSLWYCIVTCATVGYGDLYPITEAGKSLAAPMVAVAPVIYIGLIQQLWTIVKDSMHYSDRVNKQTLTKYEVATRSKSHAFRSLIGEFRHSGLLPYNSYKMFIEDMIGDRVKVAVLDNCVAEWVVKTWPNYWVKGPKISTGVGYSIILPEGYRLEEEFRKAIFQLHESGILAMLRNRYNL